jgi:hypothetical protein
MANETVNRQVNIFIQSGEAQKAYDTLIKKQQQLNAELAKTSDPKKIAQLNTELNRLSEPIDRASKKLKGDLLPTINDLTAATKKYRNEFIKTADPAALSNYQKFNAALTQQKKQLEGLQQSHHNLAQEIFGGVTLSTLFIGGIEKVKQFFEGIFEETEKADLAIRNLTNSLENFGNLEALPKLADQAEELSKKFKFLDSPDIINAQDKLVTFGKLTTGEIQKLIPVIVDYAAKTRKDLPEATDIFVKGLTGAARGLKGYATGLSETNGVAKNFSIIIDQVGKRVKGAADTFGDSATGKIASFKQAIKNAQESLGKIITDLISAPKTAGELFDEAKTKTESYTETLNPLLARYDVLKGKTSLNKDEQTELHNIIQKIVEIVPNAATEFDKYGDALDINKGKVNDFIKVSKDVLAEKEFKAIRETTQNIKDAVVEVANLKTQLNQGTKVVVSGGTGGAGVGTTFLTEEDRKEINARIISVQEKAVNLAQTLRDTFNVNFDNTGLGKSLQVFQNRLQEQQKEIEKVTLGDFNALIDRATTIKELEDAILQARAEASKELAATKDVGTQKKINDQLLQLEDAYQVKRTELSKKGDDEREKERKAAAKKAADELAQLLKDLQKIDDELQLVNLNGLQKELLQLDKKYGDLRVRAKGHAQQLLEIERLYQIERGNIIDKYAKEAAEKAAKLDEEQKKRILEIAQHANDSLGKALGDNTERDKLNVDNNLIANLFKSSRQKRKEELDAQRQQEMDALDDLLQHKVISQEQYEKDVSKIHEHYSTLRVAEDIDAAAQAAQQALDIFSSITQAQSDKENQEVENDRRRNDVKKSNLERRLKSGLLTQLQYNREVARLDLEQEQKEKNVRRKQFERDKITSIIQTTINIAEAISKALASAPPPANFIIAGIVAAAGAVQLAKIEKQKAPEFAKGGKLGGRSHAEGGNAVVDGHGRKIAEVEVGEGIVNNKTMADKRRYTVTGTPNQIISELNGLYGIKWASGGKMLPAWQRMNVPPINYDIIRRSYAMGGRFATGGVVDDPANTIANTAIEQMNDVIKGLMESNNRMQNIISAMQTTLSKGIKAYTVLSDQEKQQDRMAAIRDDATLK